MNSARLIRKGGQIDRREIARTPEEAHANMVVPDLVAILRERAQQAQMSANKTSADQPAKPKRVSKGKAAGEPKAEERSQQKTEAPKAATENSTDSTVRIRYDGSAGRFRIAGYAFRAGEVLEVTRSASEEILTYPYERFTLVEE